MQVSPTISVLDNPHSDAEVNCTHPLYHLDNDGEEKFARFQVIYEKQE